MKALKFISGMFLVAGLLVACSNEEITSPTDEPTDQVKEKIDEITLGLSVSTPAGTKGEVGTRSANDVDAAGAPKGVYPFDFMYLVKANGKIPAEKYVDYRKIDITKGTKLNIWFTDEARTEVAIRPVADESINPLIFKTTKVLPNGKVDEEHLGDTFFYSSQIPGDDRKTVGMPQRREGDPISVEYGDKLFMSEQFVFGIDDNKKLVIYQVYRSQEQVFPKNDNNLWPIQMGRFTATVNARFMFVDIDRDNPDHYGHKAEEVEARWNELFPNVSLHKTFTDGAFLTKFPITFDLCKREPVYSSHDGSILLYGDEESSTQIEKLTYKRFTSEAPIATEGWGFRSKAYPFIFPITKLNELSGVLINVCIPDLNVRMKCSIQFPNNDSYAFTANTTTFLWLMMDIDEFKALCVKEGLFDETPQTRSGGIREIEVELPSSCLYIE